MQIAPGIHRVDGTWGGNVYLLMDDLRPALVDTGLPGNAGRIAKYLTNQGLSTSQGLRILVTHGHPDHTGSIRALRKLSDVQVLAHRDDVRWDREGRPWLHYISQPLARDWGLPLFQKSYVDQLIDEETPLPILDGLTVLHTPGHTPGSVVFHLQQRGVLFSGDTLIGLGGRLVRPFPFPGTNLKLYRKSVERLEGLELDTICPGHGRPVIGRAAKRLRDMLKDYLWAASGFNRVRFLVTLPWRRSGD